MRLSVLLLVCSLAGVLGGAALIGTWALGLAIIADSVAVGVLAWNRDDGTGQQQPQAHEVPAAVEAVLARARRSG
jgi:hypothetical protein